MSEERRKILDMLAEGKITAEEADRLIAALDREPTDTPSTSVEPRKGKPKYLRVVVVAQDDDGPAKVNVRVPLQLLRAGVQLAALVPPQALERANDELRKSGIPIDLSQLKPQHIEDLIEHLADFTVDVDQADNKVQVFSE
jgi:2,3-bisphosphoglycerate-independent phosphoglycerate mutase